MHSHWLVLLAVFGASHQALGARSVRRQHHVLQSTVSRRGSTPGQGLDGHGIATEQSERATFVATNGESSFLVDDGIAFGTGMNGWGQLGLGHREHVHQLQQLNLPDEAFVKQVAVAYRHTLVLMESGEVYCTGQTFSCGLPRSSGSGIITHFMQVPGLANVRSVAAGMDYSVFLLEDGTVWATGDNSFGQLGIGRRPSGVGVPVPAFNHTDDNATGIAVGNRHTFVMTGKGNLYASGHNWEGQLGADFSDECPRNNMFESWPPRCFSPVLVANNVKLISAGRRHSLYAHTDGRLFATGSNRFGAFGNGGNESSGRFVDTTNANVSMVVAGDEISCIVRNKQLACMGWDEGDWWTHLKPTPISQAKLTESVSAGAGNHNIWFINNGMVYVMGVNWGGSLGLPGGPVSVRWEEPELLKDLQQRYRGPPGPPGSAEVEGR